MKPPTDSVTVYHYQDQPLRVFGTPNAPLFLAADVCRMLQLGTPARTVSSLDHDERHLVIVATAGGRQKMVAVTESGLYHLIFKRRKPEASAFRKWVTGELFPAIRKTIALSLPVAQQMQPAHSESPDTIAPAHTTSNDSQEEQEQAIRDLVSLMQPGEEYSVPQALALLPEGHPLARQTNLKNRISVKNALENACRFRLVERIDGSSAVYRRIS